MYSNFRTTKLFAVVVVDATTAAAAAAADDDDDDDDAVFNRLFENDDERSSSSSSSSSSLLLLLLFNSSLSFRGRVSDDDDIGLVILNSADLESNMTLLIKSSPTMLLDFSSFVVVSVICLSSFINLSTSSARVFVQFLPSFTRPSIIIIAIHNHRSCRAKCNPLSYSYLLMILTLYFYLSII